MGKLGDHLDIHGNASGYFDSETYAALVLQGAIPARAATISSGSRGLMLHDAAATRKGQKDEDGHAIHYLRDKRDKAVDVKTWLKAHKIIEGCAPPGWTSRRPNNQRVYNFIFRWRYDQTLAELGQRKDFRTPRSDSDVQTVMAAVALTAQWMDNHPECAVAAWLMSGVATQAHYGKAGPGDLAARAKGARARPSTKRRPKSTRAASVCGGRRPLSSANRCATP